MKSRVSWQGASRILWPSFLMAGGLESMLFAVIEPTDLRWFGGEPFGWPAAAIYTSTFFLFWAFFAASSALTLQLSLGASEINRDDRF